MMYRCDLCSYHSKNKADYNRHLKTRKHNRREKEVEEIKKQREKAAKKNKTYTCQKCGCGYTTNSNLIRHHKSCHSTDPNSCNNKKRNEDEMSDACSETETESDAEKDIVISSHYSDNSSGSESDSDPKGPKKKKINSYWIDPNDPEDPLDTEISTQSSHEDTLDFLRERDNTDADTDIDIYIETENENETERNYESEESDAKIYQQWQRIKKKGEGEKKLGRPKKNNNLRCTYCEEIYSRIDNLRRHMKVCSQKEFYNLQQELEKEKKANKVLKKKLKKYKKLFGKLP